MTGRIVRAVSATAVRASRVGRHASTSLVAFAIYVSGAGVTYGAQLMIARLVGSEGYGVYAYVFSWMTIFAYAAALGFDISMLRFVPVYRAQGAWPLLRGVRRYAERRVAVAGVGVVAVGIAWILARPAAFPPGSRMTFLVGIWLVPIWALLWVRCATVRALGGVVAGLVPDRLVRDGVLVVLLGLASFVLGWRMDASIAMLATVLSAALGLGLASLAVRRRWPREARGMDGAYVAAEWRRTALPLVGIAIGEVVLNRTGVVLLGWSGATRAAGIFALAFNLAFVVTLPRTAVNAWFAPTISALHALGDHAGLQRLVSRTARWTLVGALGIALPLGLLAGPLLGWFGKDFAGGLELIRILLIGQVVAAGAGSQMFVLTMTGHERAGALILIGVAAGNALLSAVLIAQMGAAGAAIAATAALIAWNAGMALFIRLRVGLAPGAWPMGGMRTRSGGVPAGVRVWLGSRTRPH
jgi:O-antigen/teichoic acid export membrane protein